MHTIITGITESGKSSYAKILSNNLVSLGEQVIVLDPYRSKGWGQKVNFADDAYKLIDQLKATRSQFFFIDESSITLEKYDRSLYWLATNSRHYGHSGFFIAQRATQIHGDIRYQCSHAIVFKASFVDAKTLTEQFASDIMPATALKQFEFLSVNTFGLYNKGIVDIKNKKINILKDKH